MGVSARAVVGPLSYLATAAIIETLKLLFVVNLVIANCSCIVHCIILVKFSLINRFQDSSIKGAILLLSLVFYLPILANLIRVGVGQPKSKLKKLMFRIFFMHFRNLSVKCQLVYNYFTLPESECWRDSHHSRSFISVLWRAAAVARANPNFCLLR